MTIDLAVILLADAKDHVDVAVADFADVQGSSPGEESLLLQILGRRAFVQCMMRHGRLSLRYSSHGLKRRASSNMASTFSMGTSGMIP